MRQNGKAGEQGDRATSLERKIQLDTSSALARDNFERMGWKRRRGEDGGFDERRSSGSSEIARWEEWRMRSGGEIFISPRRRIYDHVGGEIGGW